MTSLSGTTASRPERWASARSQRPIWSDGLADQRRIIESISVSARDKAVVQKMLTRMESHYYCLIRERDAQIARLIDSETAANLRLSVLERVSEAADMKHAVDLQMFEGSSMAMANELRTMRQEVTRARKLAASVEARTMAAILALGSELAAVEASEIEVRQVLGFLRQSNRAREQRLESLEEEVRQLRAQHEQMNGDLTAQQRRATRFGDRAVRLESLEARGKAALASAQRELAQARRENETLREQLAAELRSASALRGELVMAQEQLRVQTQNEGAGRVDAALAAENKALHARVSQLSRTLDRAMGRDDVTVRAGGGFETLPKYLHRMMAQAAVAAEAGESEAAGSARTSRAARVPPPR